MEKLLKIEFQKCRICDGTSEVNKESGFFRIKTNCDHCYKGQTLNPKTDLYYLMKCFNSMVDIIDSMNERQELLEKIIPDELPEKIDGLKKVSIKPEDTIVIFCEDNLGTIGRDRLSQQLKKTFPNNKIVTFEDGMKMAVLSEEKIKELEKPMNENTR